MAIETICSGCGQKLAVSEEHAGKRARCPTCGQIYVAPLLEQQLESSTEDHLDEKQLDPALAETIPGTPSQASSQAIPQPEQYWMQTGDGSLYGPVERMNLYRWFHEGRVGPGYQIRVGEAGIWQPADLFKPQTQAGVQGSGGANLGSDFGQSAARGFSSGGASNPYADNAYQPVHSHSIGRFQKGDPSGLVLTMGILSWVSIFLCPVFHIVPGLIAWISGSTALKDIQAGIADPTNRRQVQVGYYLGMTNVILTLLFLAGGIAIGILGTILQGF